MFVQALSRLGEEEHERAAEVATEGLLKAPELVHLFLPVLQRSLLATGQYSRVVPILESACRNPAAPPELWIALAQLHEKMGDREMAVQVFEEKAGDPRLTPAVASPLLRVLVNDLPDSDFTRIWNTLAKPEAASAWACRRCGAVHDGMRWYCPECGAFDSVGPAAPRPVEPSRPQPRSPRLLIEAPEAAAP
jgi:lipopolysaccharide biosynthesis regulator YciM